MPLGPSHRFSNLEAHRNRINRLLRRVPPIAMSCRVFPWRFRGRSHGHFGQALSLVLVGDVSTGAIHEPSEKETTQQEQTWFNHKGIEWSLAPHTTHSMSS